MNISLTNEKYVFIEQKRGRKRIYKIATFIVSPFVFFHMEGAPSMATPQSIVYPIVEVMEMVSAA